MADKKYNYMYTFYVIKPMKIYDPEIYHRHAVSKGQEKPAATLRLIIVLKAPDGGFSNESGHSLHHCTAIIRAIQECFLWKSEDMVLLERKRGGGGGVSWWGGGGECKKRLINRTALGSN